MKNEKDSLGTRMKGYENVSRHFFTKRSPLIIRLDGKAFHTYTKAFKNKEALDPFTEQIKDAMVYTMEQLAKVVQNCVFAYTQSDEISLLLNDWKTIDTEQWFGNCQNKIESVSASLATGHFNSTQLIPNFENQKGIIAFFDARAFTLPSSEVTNYFVWRQQDAIRNSIQMLGQHHFSHKELNGVGCNEIKEKLFKEKGIDWNSLDLWKQRGVCWYDKTTDANIPIFSKQRMFIEEHLLTNADKEFNRSVEESLDDIENSWSTDDDEDRQPPSSW